MSNPIPYNRDEYICYCAVLVGFPVFVRKLLGHDTNTHEAVLDEDGLGVDLASRCSDYNAAPRRSAPMYSLISI